ncbi:MAG: hypothetical protein ACJ8DI_01465 [Ktedonobacteraceae bacterium]
MWPWRKPGRDQVASVAAEDVGCAVFDPNELAIDQEVHLGHDGVSRLRRRNPLGPQGQRRLPVQARGQLEQGGRPCAARGRLLRGTTAAGDERHCQTHDSQAPKPAKRFPVTRLYWRGSPPMGQHPLQVAVTTENAKPSARQARMQVRLVTHAQAAQVVRAEWVAPASYSKVGRCSSADFSRGEVSGIILFLLLFFCLTQSEPSIGRGRGHAENLLGQDRLPRRLAEVDGDQHDGRFSLVRRRVCAIVVRLQPDGDDLDDRPSCSGRLSERKDCQRWSLTAVKVCTAV